MKNIIFYFSGTGNSLYLAKKIADEIKNTDLIRISYKMKWTDENFEKFKNVEYLGIVSPVYALGLPVFVNQFIKHFFSRLKAAGFSENKYIFVVLNYGGLSGQALSQIDKLFSKMSVPLSLNAGLKMPDNFIPAYTIPKPEKIVKILTKSEVKLAKIIKQIKAKNTERDRTLPAFILPFADWLFRMFYNAFVSMLRRKNFAKDFWVNENCNGCEICKQVCPVANVSLSAQKKPVWDDKCEFCLACISWCPQKAIEYKKATLNKTRYSNPKIGLNEIKMGER